MYTHTLTIPSYSQTQTLRLVAPSPAYAPITTAWIRRPEVTQYLGADFSHMTEEDEVAHLQNPKNWGQGLGSYAKQAACNWAFSEGGFAIIEAKAYVQNIRSWSALERLGYRYAGIEQGKVAGKPVVWKVYTLARADWEELSWGEAPDDAGAL